VRRIIIPTLAFSAFLSNCGVSPQQHAAKDVQAMQQQQQYDAAFQDNLKKKISAGEKPPTFPAMRFNVGRVVANQTWSLGWTGKDPGYAIVDCQAPSAKNFGVIDFSGTFASDIPGLTKSSVICANSEFGKNIIKLRKWYCSDDRECVLTEWNDNHPIRGHALNYSASIQGVRLNPGPTNI
jgi:hypothetical protein